MAENKNTFVFYAEWKQDFEFLTDAEAGKLIKHLLQYVNDENPEFENEDRLLQFAAQKIKNVLKKDLKKYEEVCKKRSEAGKKGGVTSGRSRASKQEKPNEANASNSKQNERDNEYEYDNEYDILLEKESKEENTLKEDLDEIYSEIINDDNDSYSKREEIKKVAQKKERFKPPSVDEVQKYCNERQNDIQAFKFVNFYQSKGWKVGNQPMKDWKAAIRSWEQKDKENGKSKTNSNNTNNGYSNHSGNSTMGKGGKVSAAALLAERVRNQTSGNGNGGNFSG
ncbi:DUF6291 domain-containing protein [Chryseobacterium aquaticum]|uniref:DUF6291 domain-containing protein n=1 Tax=Chryseobacterium aquaticum subsp. greenlandense TaxID=345663 RepID=A0A101CDV0_9FLAO|nr:DUF6291 domain-containing protein [Chryseobacterium aquaticum]KUJ54009.1 hypothetical protein AR686_17635 [Chryseobacterium aquaticum subsp. greenlandense]